MNIDELVNRKHQLEHDLEVAIQQLLDMFTQDTGQSVERVSVYMSELETIGEREVTRICRQVVCGLGL